MNNPNTLFNHGSITINGVTFQTAQRWRTGFTVPEVVTLRAWCNAPVEEGYTGKDGRLRCADCPESSEPPQYTGELISEIAARTDLATQPDTFTCDTCEGEASLNTEVFLSPMLTCSRFCSPICRDTAEMAAENARQR